MLETSESTVACCQRRQRTGSRRSCAPYGRRRCSRCRRVGDLPRCCSWRTQLCLQRQCNTEDIRQQLRTNLLGFYIYKHLFTDLWQESRIQFERFWRKMFLRMKDQPWPLWAQPGCCLRVPCPHTLIIIICYKSGSNATYFTLRLMVIFHTKTCSFNFILTKISFIRLAKQRLFIMRRHKLVYLKDQVEFCASILYNSLDWTYCAGYYLCHRV